MSIVTEKYTRKPFEIEAIRVTEDNMEDVAQWCGGEIHKTEVGKRYIKVDVIRPLTEKQTKAFAGDWVLKNESGKNGFKVYQHKAFINCFQKILEAVESKPEPKIYVPAGYPEPSTR